MNSNAVAEFINTKLDNVSFARLLLKKGMFSFVDMSTVTTSFGGPPKLKLVLSKFDPDKIIDVGLLWQRLQMSCLCTYNNIGHILCGDVEETAKQILGLCKDCGSMFQYTITAFLPGLNARFNSVI